MWNAGRRVKQWTEYLVESVIRPKGQRQYRRTRVSEQERFFHVIISGQSFTPALYRLARTIFPLERSIFDGEHLTFRRTMRAEPFQVRNFINGQFVEPVSGKYLDNVEPATGKPYSQVADSERTMLILRSLQRRRRFVIGHRNRQPIARAFYCASPI